MALAMLIGLTTAGCAGRRMEHRAAPGALGPYSGSVLAGDWIFVSGKIGERGGALEHEIQTTIDALEQELAASGASLADVASVTAYLTSLDDYAAFNEIYARRFPRPHPARAVVGVSALPGGARVEIQAIARRP